MKILRDIFRFFRAQLSFPFNKKETSLSKKDQKLLNEIYFKAKQIEKDNKIKLNTHIIFSKSILNLILKKNLLNFLQKGFIQQMFFIHNRFFILFELLEMIKDKNWNFWKKIIKEDNIGNPVKFFLYPYSSGNKIHQTYHLKKYKDFSKVNLKKFNNILELGGGYGNMAKTFYKLNNRVNYTIFDTKEVSLLQLYYLKRSNINVGFGSSKKIKLINNFRDLKKIFSKHKKGKNLLIANWSISEFPIKLRKDLNFIFKYFDHQIISFQNNFEMIDNNKYFQKINKLNKVNNRTSKIIELNSKKNNFYLFSFKKEK